MNPDKAFSRYASAVMARPNLSHATVRVGLWLLTVASKQGGFPVIAYNNDLIRGINKEGVVAPGVTYRPETVRAAIQSLQEEGMLSVIEHSEPRYLKEFTITV